jgi:hypothetical protein
MGTELVAIVLSMVAYISSTEMLTFDRATQAILREMRRCGGQNRWTE